jgi:hypothetical protein
MYESSLMLFVLLFILPTHLFRTLPPLATVGTKNRVEHGTLKERIQKIENNNNLLTLPVVMRSIKQRVFQSGRDRGARTHESKNARCAQ